MIVDERLDAMPLVMKRDLPEDNRSNSCLCCSLIRVNVRMNWMISTDFDSISFTSFISDHHLILILSCSCQQAVPIQTRRFLTISD